MVLYCFTRFPFPRLDYGIFGWAGLGQTYVGLNVVNRKILCRKRSLKSFLQYGTKKYHVSVLHQKRAPVKTIGQLITTTAVLVK